MSCFEAALEAFGARALEAAGDDAETLDGRLVAEALAEAAWASAANDAADEADHAFAARRAVDEAYGWSDCASVEGDAVATAGNVRDAPLSMRQRPRPSARGDKAVDLRTRGYRARGEADVSGRQFFKVWPCVTPLPPPAAFDQKHAIKASAKRPDGALQLEWVHGIETTAVVGRNLCKVGATEVCYAAAALVVLYDVTKKTQRHFRGHGSRRVTCVCVCEDGPLAASGEAAALPEVLVWSTKTLEVVHRLGGGFFGANILHVILRTDGLVAVDGQLNHTLGYWRVQELHKMRAVSEKAPMQGGYDMPSMEVGDLHGTNDALRNHSRDPACSARAQVFEPPAIYDMCWLPGGQRFVTVGPNRHLKFWNVSRREDKIEASWQLEFTPAIWPSHLSSKGIDGGKDQATPVLFRCCYSFALGALLTGAGDGKVYCWVERKCVSSFEAAASPRRGPVRGLVLDGKGTVYAGAVDGAIRGWRGIASEAVSKADVSKPGAVSKPSAASKPGVLKRVSWERSAFACAMDAPVRDLVVFEDGSFVAATMAAAVCRIDAAGLCQVLFKAHFAPHVLSQLRCCAGLFPRQELATAGADGMLHVYDTNTHALLRSRALEYRAAACLDVSSDFIVVGFEDGSASTYDAASLSLKATTQIVGARKRKPAPSTRASQPGLKALGGAAGFLAAHAAGQGPSTAVAACGVECVQVKGQIAAFGGGDGTLAVSRNVGGLEVWRLRISKARLLCVDLDETAQFARVVTRAFELLCLDVGTRSIVSASVAADLEWPRASCTLGFEKMGCWPSKSQAGASSRAILAADARGGFVAVGGDAALVRVLAAPAVVADAPCMRPDQGGAAHGSAVVAVRWLPGGADRLVTCGGHDRTCLVWRVVPGEAQRPSTSASTETMQRFPVGAPAQPGVRMATCHLCGRDSSLATFATNHVPSCERKWVRQRELAAQRHGGGHADEDDDDDPGPLPPNPHAGVAVSGLRGAALERFNSTALAAYEACVLRQCLHCGRRFDGAPKLRKHQRGCSSARPFKALAARDRDAG